MKRTCTKKTLTPKKQKIRRRKTHMKVKLKKVK